MEAGIFLYCYPVSSIRAFWSARRHPVKAPSGNTSPSTERQEPIQHLGTAGSGEIKEIQFLGRRDHGVTLKDSVHLDLLARHVDGRPFSVVAAVRRKGRAMLIPERRLGENVGANEAKGSAVVDMDFLQDIPRLESDGLGLGREGRRDGRWGEHLLGTLLDGHRLDRRRMRHFGKVAWDRTENLLLLLLGQWKRHSHWLGGGTPVGGGTGGGTKPGAGAVDEPTFAVLDDPAAGAASVVGPEGTVDETTVDSAAGGVGRKMSGE